MVHDVDDIVRRVQRAVIEEENECGLLRHRERQVRREEDDPLTGHCAVAAEAVYHLLGARRPYRLMNASWVESGEKWTHWWVEDTRTGWIIDPTASQFSPQMRNWIYTRGVSRGLPTPKRGYVTQPPSKRALRVIRRSGVSYQMPERASASLRTT